MKPFAGAFLFLMVLVAGGVPTALAADPPDSSANPVSTPDISTVAAPPPADTTTAPASSGPITVILRNGTTRRYERVEPGENDTVRAHRSDGTVDTIPTRDIDTITSEVPKTPEGSSEVKKSWMRSFTSSFRGAPLPEKKGFPLFQAGILIRADNPPNKDESKASSWFDAGGMVNLSPKFALGGTVGVAASGFEYSRIAVKARLRRWLGDGLALDFAPGVFVPKGGTPFDSDEDPNRGDVGFVGEVAFSAKDWVSFAYVVEVIEADRASHLPGGTFPSETDIAHHFGMKVGGGMGLAGVGILLIALFAASD